jgi:hypothetical protein
MAAMINNSSKLKPRVVIFHMTASTINSKRRVSLQGKNRAKLAVHVSVGKPRPLAKTPLDGKCLKVDTVDRRWRAAEQAAAQFVKHSLALSHHYLRETVCPGFVCQIAAPFSVDTGIAGFCYLLK